MIGDVGNILSMLGFNPLIYFDDKYGRINLNGIGAFKRYQKLIGWRSQKNLNRVLNWKIKYRELDNMTDVA